VRVHKVRAFGIALPIVAMFELGFGCATALPERARARPQRTELSGPTEPSPEPAREKAKQGSGLLFSVTPSDAEISVDGTVTGKVADIEARGGLLEMKPGIYQVSLKRRGFVTWRAEVTVGDGPETIQVTMVHTQ
jgi:hypothetical protein